jgi:hypothetical protein
MGFFQPQNPGPGGLDELTNAEEAFLTSLAGLSYSEGDVLTIVNNSPVWENMAQSYAVRYDDVGSDIAYLGEAIVGTSSASALWRIRKLDSSNLDLVVTWADGDSDFNNIWDDRISLTYS